MEDIKNYKSVRKIQTLMFKMGKKIRFFTKISEWCYTTKRALNLIRTKETSYSHNATPLLLNQQNG